MERDFTLMRRAAALVAALPFVGSPSVKESVMQVGGGLWNPFCCLATHAERERDAGGRWLYCGQLACW